MATGILSRSPGLTDFTGFNNYLLNCNRYPKQISRPNRPHPLPLELLLVTQTGLPAWETWFITSGVTAGNIDRSPGLTDPIHYVLSYNRYPKEISRPDRPLGSPVPTGAIQMHQMALRPNMEQRLCFKTRVPSNTNLHRPVIECSLVVVALCFSQNFTAQLSKWCRWPWGQIRNTHVFAWNNNSSFPTAFVHRPVTSCSLVLRALV